MGFRSAKEYNEAKYKNWFVLRDDKDYADVIFLYRSYEDVLVADAHYIKSDEYSGYVHCCGRSCPACGKTIRVQQKLFIPVYNIATDEILFWDRSFRFERQLSDDVFSKYPDPCNYVFRITRNGASGDLNTTYSIQAVGTNKVLSYEAILAKFNVMLPAYYEVICKDMQPAEMSTLLNSVGSNNGSSSSFNGELPSYQVTPRASSMMPPVHDPVSEDTATISIPSDDDSDPGDGDDSIDNVTF